MKFLIVAMSFLINVSTSPTFANGDLKDFVGTYREMDSCRIISIELSEDGQYLEAVSDTLQGKPGCPMLHLNVSGIYLLEEVSGSHLPTFKAIKRLSGVNNLNLSRSTLQFSSFTTGRFLDVILKSGENFTFSIPRR